MAILSYSTHYGIQFVILILIEILVASFSIVTFYLVEILPSDTVARRIEAHETMEYNLVHIVQCKIALIIVLVLYLGTKMVLFF